MSDYWIVGDFFNMVNGDPNLTCICWVMICMCMEIFNTSELCDIEENELLCFIYFGSVCRLRHIRVLHYILHCKGVELEQILEVWDRDLEALGQAHRAELLGIRHMQFESNLLVCIGLWANTTAVSESWGEDQCSLNVTCAGMQYICAFKYGLCSFLYLCGVTRGSMFVKRDMCRHAIHLCI